jgi:ABC-2 type transport system ATP-binding protein
MSSHILTEVDRLATHIGIIHQGQLIEDLEMEQLAHFRTRRLEITVRDPYVALAALVEAGYLAAANGQKNTINIDDPRAIEAPEDIATLLVTAQMPPQRLVVVQQNLEEHFMQLTGGSK